MSAATPHSISLSARGAAWTADTTDPAANSAAATNLTLISRKKKRPVSRAPLRCAYCALPLPLVDGLVAVSLEGAVLGEASPGPAVVPVLPEPPGVTALPDGLVVAPPVAEPVVPAEESVVLEPVAPDTAPRGARASRMQDSRSTPVMDSQRLVSALLSAVGALGSPDDWVLGTPPVEPVPVLLAPDAWARIIVSPAADTCAAKGRVRAAATATVSNLSFISVSWLNEKRNLIWPRASPRFTAINVPRALLR
jgi:hypothetical protein